jgi:hypothetical protein
MTSSEAWTFILLPIVIVIVGLVIAGARRGNVRMVRIGSRRLELRSPGAPATVFERIKSLGGRYRLDDADPATHRIVLSTSPTLATWGFFYPIEIHADGESSRIEIGIQSRLIQLGPLVTRAHKQCAEAIQTLLGVPAARVA